MTALRLQVRYGTRDPARLPAEDEALGTSVFGMLAGALEHGLPRPAYLVLREDQVDHVDALPILRLPPEQGQRMLSAIAGQPGVQCVALASPLTLRTGPRTGGRALVVFLEWPDNRWWTAWQPLDEGNRLLGEEPATRAAADGWPKPGGGGGWFAMARRLGLRLTVTAHEADGSPAMVH